MNDRREASTRSGWVLVLLAAAVLGGGCDGGASDGRETTRSAGEAAAAEGTDDAAAVAGDRGSVASADPAAAPAGAGVQDCEPEPPTGASSGWSRYDSGEGGFSFAHPADWEKLDPIQVTGAFDPASYAEAGLPADSRTSLEVVRNPAGFPNVVVYRLPGVRSPLDTLYARHETRFRSLPQIVRILGSELSTCLAGEAARGMDFVFRQDVIDLETGEQSESDQTAYQRSWFAVRDGVLYHVQFLAADSSGTGTLDEVLRTWSWPGGSRAAALLDAVGGEAGAVGAADPAADRAAEQVPETPDPADSAAPTGAAEGTADFAEAEMASGVDTSREEPDPASFTTSFPQEAPGVYVVYRLEEGDGGNVTATWKKEGQVVHTDEAGSIPGGRWAFLAITPAPGGFQPGSYEVTLAIEGTTASRTLPFTIAAPVGP